MIEFEDFLYALFLLALVVLVGIVGTSVGRNAVVEACSLYGRYYVEPPSDNDPMGYYINCNVTGGPEIAANSSEGKKR